MILIIGAGLAGLSTAYHLNSNDGYQICEKEGEAGGLCRSYEKGGFTFDYTGHLLHLRDRYTRELVEQLLPGKLKTLNRCASIYSKDVLTPYPFQANLYSLPKDVVKDCLVGFFEAEIKRANNHRDRVEKGSFKDWIVTTFGSGIARHFMVPYNEKLWKRDLESLSSDWVDWSIPIPSVDEVIGGALGLENQNMGYNAQFLYPERGGIGVLPQAFLPHLNTVCYNRPLTAINLQEKRAWFADSSSINYDYLVTTVPLPELITSVMASVKDKQDIAVGNVVGSNIFNILWVLGFCSLINAFALQGEILKFHIPVMIIVSLLLVPIMKSGRIISRKEGALLLVIYFSYMAVLYKFFLR